MSFICSFHTQTHTHTQSRCMCKLAPNGHPNKNQYKQSNAFTRPMPIYAVCMFNAPNGRSGNIFEIEWGEKEKARCEALCVFLKCSQSLCITVKP